MRGCSFLRNGWFAFATLGVFSGVALTADAPPTDAPKPQHTRAVMTGDQVVQILDETVDWYRTLGAQQQSATQPSDLLILYANRQTADKVIGLAFEIAQSQCRAAQQRGGGEPS